MEKQWKQTLTQASSIQDLWQLSSESRELFQHQKMIPLLKLPRHKYLIIENAI